MNRLVCLRKFCYPTQVGEWARVSKSPRDRVESWGAECWEGQRAEKAYGWDPKQTKCQTLKPKTRDTSS